MTWTYVLSELSTNETYQVRTLIGDTDVNAQLLQDEEIAWAITQESNLWSSSARCAEMIGFQFTRKVDTKLGRSMQIVYSKTAEAYFSLSKWLRKKAMGTNIPYVGGVYASDYLAIAQNNTILAPLFTKTMQENEWTGGYSSDSLLPTTNDPILDAGQEEDG